MEDCQALPVKRPQNQGRNYWGGGGDTPNVVISGNFNNFNEALVGQKMCNSEFNSCRKMFDKFTKILLKNFTNYGRLVLKLVKNSISENKLCVPVCPKIK